MTEEQYVQKQSGVTTIEGADYPILGVVDMSLCMVDVTDQPAHIGDRATADINPLMVNPRVLRIYQNDRA